MDTRMPKPSQRGVPAESAFDVSLDSRAPVLRSRESECVAGVFIEPSFTGITQSGYTRRVGAGPLGWLPSSGQTLRGSERGRESYGEPSFTGVTQAARRPGRASAGLDESRGYSEGFRRQIRRGAVAMSNNAKNVDYSSDDEEEESEESEEEEQPTGAKPKPSPQQQQVKMQAQDRKPQDEEEESSEEESETDNEAERYTTMRRDLPPAGAKAAQSVNPAAKRGRDAELKDEEPASKKSKDGKVEKAKAPLKTASPMRPTRADPKAQAPKPKPVGKSQPVEREENTRASGVKKRKASPTPPSNGGAKQRADGASPAKAKTPFSWTANLEMALATILHNEKKQGRPLTGSKNDPYWGKVAKDMALQGISVTEAQLSEKVKRMKHKWKTYKEKEATNPWKNDHERRLFNLWEATWGTGTVSGVQASRPVTPQGTLDDDEEEESDEEEEQHRGPGLPNSRREEEEEEEEESEDEEEDHEPKKAGANHEGPSKDATKPYTPASTVSPFVSKPRLEYTPVLPKDRRKPEKRGEEASIAEQNGAEEYGEEEDHDGRTPSAVAELLTSLKKESFSILAEVRAGCLEALSSIRQQTTSVFDDVRDSSGRFGMNSRVNSGSMTSVERNILDELINNTMRSGTNTAGSSQNAELKDHWRQLRLEEMDLTEKRIQLTLKHLQLARKELQEQDK
ncbi:hypothetical protein R1sor_019986 [Riccia sorocarpa]|uniref:Glabrous enhancer-binding protein-like DBD domain-containing protein n=1 Tax=Riccia sorocarpa TaxID=122646 RepID=A0ABD3IFR7_9MARC